MSQPDMNAIFAQAQQMQAQLQAAQAEIVATTVTGQAGGGLVKVSLGGDGQIHDITIDPQVVDPEDVETLQDLIVGAHRDAATQVQKLAEEKMGPLAGGLGF